MQYSKVIVSNIEENLTEDELKKILLKYQVPFVNQFKIMNSKDSIEQKELNKRYTILEFETEEIARYSVDIIQSIKYRQNHNKKQIHFQACIFVSDYKVKIEQGAGLIVFNLPQEIRQLDVYELFSQFVLQCGMIENNGQNIEYQYNNAKILFQTKEEAQEAAKQINGKFLGKHQILAKQYHTVQWQLENNRDILVKDCPDDVTSQDIVEGLNKLGFNDFLDENDQDMFISQPIETFDGPTRNVIFTCKNKEIAQQILNKCNQQKLIINGKEVNVAMKLTKGMISYLKANGKYDAVKIDNQKNIQVYGVTYKQVSSQEVYDFFSKYGQIELFSKPNVTEGYDINTAYFNIQYETQEEANQAMKYAVEDEQKLQNRLTETQLKIIYQNGENKDDKQTQDEIE